MAVMKGVNPTKGNPRPIAKPVVPTKAPTKAPAKLPSLGGGGMGSERNALKRSNSITTPTQMLNPGTRLPLTPNQGSRLYNPSTGARPLAGIGQVKPPTKPLGVPLGTPGTIPPAFQGLNTAAQGLGNQAEATGNNIFRQLLQGLLEMGDGQKSPFQGGG